MVCGLAAMESWPRATHLQAAIQWMNQKLEQKKTEIAELKQTVDELKRRDEA
jgi:cell division protein FtsL